MRNASPFEQLSSRERRVVSLLSAGLTMLETAEQMNLSDTRVKQHIREAKDKLDCKTTAQLCSVCTALGLLEQDKDETLKAA